MVAEHDASGHPTATTLPIPNPTAEKPAATSNSTTTDSAKADRQFNRGRGRGRGRGNRGGQQGRGRGGDKWEKGGKQRKDLSRSEYHRRGSNRRELNSERQENKRRKLNENGEGVPTDNGRGPAPGGPNYMNIEFPEEEIAAEERRPKRKVAVMIGYSGTGYHGLQINHRDKTIEGDLFAAFVAASAISKANASDPRKSSLVRTARTDKGVHAAGNVISLKLIIEDPDVVKKINDALPPQIRVWGIQRTNNAFSCYHSCESRWYEYLMPSYCLLPPHPDSFLGKKVLESVKEKGVEAEYYQRLADVKDFWDEVEKNDIQPIIDSLVPEVREVVLRRKNAVESEKGKAKVQVKPEETSNDAEGDAAAAEQAMKPEAIKEMEGVEATGASAPSEQLKPEATEGEELPPKEPNPVDLALKRIKAAYVAAKRRYRVSAERLAQLQEALDEYKGTRNFHNYTVQKSFKDPSSKRHIKSFVVNPNPVQINDTQWLSLKVHGQSFMMHQIRKMVGMAVLVTRCATDLSRIDESYGEDRISIPKAPGLGLLLERPVFDGYNEKARESYDRPEIDFKNYEKELEEFKNTMIYKHIFELEERENSFHTFFHQIDNFKSDYFLWVTAGGLAAAHKRVGQADDVPEEMKEELGDEEEEEGSQSGDESGPKVTKKRRGTDFDKPADKRRRTEKGAVDPGAMDVNDDSDVVPEANGEPDVMDVNHDLEKVADAGAGKD